MDEPPQGRWQNARSITTTNTAGHQVELTTALLGRTGNRVSAVVEVKGDAVLDLQQLLKLAGRLNELAADLVRINSRGGQP